MHELSAEEYRTLIVAELLELPRHTEFGIAADSVEFGSNYTDLCNCALLMSHTLWFPADFIMNGAAGAREVTPAELRNVRRGILVPDTEHPVRRAFVKFELAAPGRTSADMREIFWAFHTRRLCLDRRYDDYNRSLATLIAHYLDARDANTARDVKHLNANRQESINITLGG